MMPLQQAGFDLMINHGHAGDPLGQVNSTDPESARISYL